MLVFSRLRQVVGVDLPLDTYEEVVAQSNGYVVGADENVDEEEHEVLAVPETDTVVDPLTMMVEPLDTLVANVAMPRFRGANNFTSRA